MVIRLLLAALVIGTQLGCLGFFEEPTAVVPRPNNPPWIDEATMEPQTHFVTIDKTSNPEGSKSFSLKQAWDFDRGDLLHAYWLLGRQEGAVIPQVCENKQPPLPENFNPFERRDVNFTCVVRFSLSRLVVGKDVVLELFVVDREVFFEDVNTGSPKWPVGNHYTSVKWILQVR